MIQWRIVMLVEYVVIIWNRNILKMNASVAQIFTLDLNQNKMDKLSFRIYSSLIFINSVILEVSELELYFGLNQLYELILHIEQ